MERQWQEVDAISLAGKLNNEDLYGCSGPLAWVIDGATPLSEQRLVHSVSTDAVWIVREIDKGIRRRAESSAPLNELLAEVIDDVRIAAASEWTTSPEIPPSAAVAVTRLTDSSVEYTVLGDVSATFIYPQSATTICDNRPDSSNEEAKSRLSELLATGQQHADAMLEVRELLLRHRRSAMNTNSGYWVAALDPKAAEHALLGEVAVPSRLLLATDGFDRGRELFRLWDVDAFRGASDLLDLAVQLRSAELVDSGCRHYPRWSRSDDLTALLLAPVPCPS